MQFFLITVIELLYYWIFVFKLTRQALQLEFKISTWNLFNFHSFNTVESRSKWRMKKYFFCFVFFHESLLKQSESHHETERSK